MTKLQWNTPGSARYETGVQKGVLYVSGLDGVPWNGLTSVAVRDSGESKAFYMDGDKYLDRPVAGDCEATITAFTYPDEFYQCDGSPQSRSGLFVSRQRRRSFGLSYRTIQGNDLAGGKFGYKIHLLYNAKVSPAEKSYSTLSDSIDVEPFSWNVTTTPARASGLRPTAYVVIDSRLTNPVKLQALEELLYGTDDDQPRLPTLTEVVALYDDPLEFTLTDHGDGSYTIVAPNSNLEILSNGRFIFDWPIANPVDADTFTITD